MANSFKLAEAVVELKTNNSLLDSGIAAARTQINSFLSTVNRGIGAGIGFSATTIGIETLAHGIKNLVHAGMELEESQVRLHTALDLAGNGALALESHFDSLAATMAGKLNIAANETREVLAYLTTVGIPINSIEDMTKAAAGLAFVLHTDLKGGAINLERALAGNFGQLQRSLPSLVQFKDNAQKLAFVLEVSGKGLEAVGRQQQTAAGHVRTMDTAVTQLAQSLSSALGPATVSITDKVTTLVRSFTSGTKEINAFEQMLLKAAAAESHFFGDKTGEARALAQVEQLKTQYDEVLKREASAGKVGFDPTNIHAFTKQAKDLHATLASINSLEGFWKKAQLAALGKGGDGDSTGSVGGPGKGLNGWLKDIQKAAKDEIKTFTPSLGTITNDPAAAAARLKHYQQILDSAAMDPRNAEALGRGAFGGKLADYINPNYGRGVPDTKIAEHGSVANADAKTTRQRIAAIEENNLSRRFTDEYDPVRFARLKEKAEEYYGPRIAAEKANQKIPDSVQGNAIRDMLQNSLGLPRDGKPIKVQSTTEDRLIKSIDTLNGILPGLGGFPGGE